ncbi:MAG: DUF1566 domain-containing protein [Sediminibacterium sp.]|jgi:hypothetical protein
MKKVKLILVVFGIFVLSIHGVAQKYIINNPLKIGDLLVARSDFKEQMKWADSRKACEKLADGWRLPNRKELNFLYENKNKIPGLHGKYYWTIEQSIENHAWLQFFNDGTQDDYLKFTKCWVRPVKNVDLSK